MRNFVQRIEIENFKSFNHALIEGCDRVNLFIGRPNVGKSNLLEALGLFSLPFSKLNSSKKISDFVRVENEAELFFDGNIEKPILIGTNIGDCRVHYPNVSVLPTSGPRWSDLKRLAFDFNFPKQENNIRFFLDERMNVKSSSPFESNYPIKKYSFSTKIKGKQSSLPFLIPPHGANLLNVIGQHKDLKEDLLEIFLEYGLELVFDKASQSIKITKKNRSSDLFLIPYDSISDTLQRIIFFKSAVASNENSILLFEEPEAHSFPPYIAHITQQIVHSSTNQFFISTHSPYIINDFLENNRDELSIFTVDFQHGETVVKRLSKDELHDIYQYGLDLFANHESFLR